MNKVNLPERWCGTSFEKQDLFCPSCGKQELWRECGEGDYYKGADYLCLGCESLHHLDSSNNDLGYSDKKTLDAIKEKIKNGEIV